MIYVIASMITGGTQTHLLQVFRFLDRSRFQPHLFCLRDEGNLIAAVRDLDVPVQTFGMKGTLREPGDLAGLGRIVRSMRDISPAIVHAYLLRGNFFGAVAARLAAVPVVVSSRRGLHTPAGLAERFAVRVSNRLADVVTGNSPRVLEFTREVEKPVPTRMKMIPSGIDTERFDPEALAEGARTRVRESLGLGDGPVVGTAFTFQPKKGFPMLFESLARLRVRVPAVRLLIAGESELTGQPRALADDLGITEAITLLGRRDDMPEVLSALDVFLLPSRSEGMSNAILEAMAMRVPVVATAVGGAPVVIDDGLSGLLVEYGDVTAMADGAAELLLDGQRAGQMGREARERIVAAYSAPAMVAETERLYARLLEEKQL